MAHWARNDSGNWTFKAEIKITRLLLMQWIPLHKKKRLQWVAIVLQLESFYLMLALAFDFDSMGNDASDEWKKNS